MASRTSLRTESISRVYDKEKDTQTSAVDNGCFGIDDKGSLNVYVVDTRQGFLGAEGVGGTHGGDDFLCESTTQGNVLESKPKGRMWMWKGGEKERYELHIL